MRPREGRLQRGSGLARAKRTSIGAIQQTRCLSALFVRDLMMRYGREQVGFVWVILEPMLLTVGVMGLWSMLKGGAEHGVQVVELVLTGYMLLTLWRHLTGSTLMLFRRNSSLLLHRKISLLDLAYSRFLLEFAAATSALICVSSTLIVLGIVAPIADWTWAVFGWVSMAGLGFGAGLFLVAVSEQSESVDRLVQPIQYLLIPLSGTFFMVDWLPERVQSIVLLNPLVHCYEMFRAGFMGPSVATHFSSIYIFGWVFLLVFCGLYGVQRVKAVLQTV